MQSEKNKTGTHINKVKLRCRFRLLKFVVILLLQVVQDVWKTFLQEQYNELRNDVREQQLQKVAILKESEEELKHLKIKYTKITRNHRTRESSLLTIISFPFFIATKIN